MDNLSVIINKFRTLDICTISDVSISLTGRGSKQSYVMEYDVDSKELNLKLNYSDVNNMDTITFIRIEHTEIALYFDEIKEFYMNEYK